MEKSIYQWLGESRRSGLSDDQITELLAQQGWEEQQIVNLLSNQQTPPSKDGSGKKIILWIVAVTLLVIGVAVAAYLYWFSDQGNVNKTLNTNTEQVSVDKSQSVSNNNKSITVTQKNNQDVWEQVDSSYVLDITTDQNGELFGLIQNIFEINGNKTQIVRYTESGKEIIAEFPEILTDMFIDSKNNVWTYDFLEKKSLYMFKDNEWTSFASEDFLTDNRINDISENKEGLWLATKKGLIYYNYATWTTYMYEDWDPDDLLQNNDVKQVESNDDYTIFSTMSGLFKVEDSQFIKISESHFGHDLFLSSNNIAWQYHDVFGRAIYATSLEDNMETVFGTEDGLKSLSIADVASDDAEMLWAVGQGDLTDTGYTFEGINVYDGSSWSLIDNTDGIDEYGPVDRVEYVAEKLYILFHNGYGLYSRTMP